MLPVSANGYPYHVSYDLPWEDSSPPYSPTGYNTPNHDFNGPYFQPYSARSRQHSNASYSGYTSSYPNSRSPISAGSSTVYLPQWTYGASDEPLKYMNPSSGSEGAFGPALTAYSSNLADPNLLPGNAEYRDFMEQGELIVPTSSPQGTPFDLSLEESTSADQERYLTAYWSWVHPFFPVIHRPSFSLQHASPLLRAAVLALGAHALGDATNKTNGRIAHERCLKVLKKVSYTWRLYMNPRNKAC